ncbi:MAG: hypothetical protein KF900_03190 [Bacteroidetes bacterium]|nr:hypothetical protein [Bacteroidota bacterium]
MFHGIAEILLRSQIKKDNSGVKKQFMAWDSVQKIALIVSGHNDFNKSALDKFISDSKKNIEVFYVELKSKQATFGDWQCFSKKDKNTFNLPKKIVLDELHKKQFDLVINTCHEEEIFATSICAAIPAAFKTGHSGKFNDVNIIIHRTEPYNLISYLNDVLRYLKMIKV